MNCKNCEKPLDKEAHFCDNCGGKVVKERLTFGKLLLEFFIVNFGVDSRFFLTLKKMATQPDTVINEYLSGVRRRYINPFAFLAVAAGLSLIIFNYFADDFIAIQESMQTDQIKDLKEKAALDISKMKNLSDSEIQKLKIEKKTAQFQLDLNSGMWEFMLKYLNLLTFVLLLIYAILSKWTFWKPHNFGEHLVINGYAYGFTTYITLLLFFIAIVIHPTIYIFAIPISMVYYMYVFGKFYKLSIGKNILKLLRFLFGLLVIAFVLIGLSIIIGITIAALGLIDLN